MLFLLALVYSCEIQAQEYDTISFPHRYAHETHIILLDGKVFKGPLVDAMDSSIIVSAENKGDSIFEIHSMDILSIKVFRSNFERSTTTNLIVLGAGGAAFFTSLNYFGNRKDDLRFKNSEWLISGIATLVVMPIAALISNAVYLSPREKYSINGDQNNFQKAFPELSAYSFWTYLSSK